MLSPKLILVKEVEYARVRLFVRKMERNNILRIRREQERAIASQRNKMH
jgi:hypothetical protein